MRILVVEDDAPLNRILVRTLKEESYAVDSAEDGQEAEWLAFENPYDLIVLDLMLPIKHGFEVLKNIREGGIDTPVLILTAKDSKEDVVKGLDLGADDYMTKPFDLNEFLARVRSVSRRQSGQLQTKFSAGPLLIDPARKEVTCEGQPIELTAKEYSLLVYFARNADTVLSRTQLSEHVWDMNFEPTSNVVDVYVGYLRNKIEDTIGVKLIKTVRGHGYMLDTSSFSKEGRDRVESSKTHVSSGIENSVPTI